MLGLRQVLLFGTTSSGLEDSLTEDWSANFYKSSDYVTTTVAPGLASSDSPQITLLWFPWLQKLESHNKTVTWFQKMGPCLAFVMWFSDIQYRPQHGLRLETPPLLTTGLWALESAVTSLPKSLHLGPYSSLCDIVCLLPCLSLWSLLNPLTPNKSWQFFFPTCLLIWLLVSF